MDDVSTSPLDAASRDTQRAAGEAGGVGKDDGRREYVVDAVDIATMAKGVDKDSAGEAREGMVDMARERTCQDVIHMYWRTICWVIA